MKKLAAFILTIFTLTAALFAAALPSLDGRAVVADEGTMPKGLFARTVGYLPGDSVTVTNPESGTSTEILVLGAIDPSEGVVILLSPEAAKALKINPGANVQVKLTKRSGNLDENAAGSAVLSNNSEEDENPEDEDDNLAETSGDENSENSEPQGDSAEELAENAEALPYEEIPESPADAESYSALSEEPKNAEEETPAENIAEEPADDADDNEVSAEEIAEAPAAEEKTPEYEEPSDEISEIQENTPEESPAEEIAETPAVKEESPVEKTPIEETPVNEAAAAESDESSPVAKNASKDQLQQVEVIPLENEPEKEAEKLPVHEEELPALAEGDKKNQEPVQPVVVVETEPQTKSSEENDEISADEEIVPASSEPEKTDEKYAAEEPEEIEETPVVAEAEKAEKSDENALESVNEENPSAFEEPAAAEDEKGEAEKTLAQETAPALANEEEPSDIAEEKSSDENISPADEEIAAYPEVEKEPEVVSESLDSEALDSKSTAENFAEKTPAEVSEVSSGDEAFQPIVLVPTEPNPPADDGRKDNSSKIAKVEPEKELAPEPVKEPAPSAKPALSNDWRNYVVPSHKNLVKGRYYIQIASLSKESNIKNLIEKYSSKYPMVLIESTNGKSYQVMVGPLNIDEYGSVLEKMKANGYKDAFVKKIN